MSPEVLSLIIGVILPPFIDFENKYIEDSNWRYIASVAVCLVVGGISSALQGKLSIADVLGSGAIIFAAAQSTYKLYWKDSSTRASLYGSDVTGVATRGPASK